MKSLSANHFITKLSLSHMAIEGSKGRNSQNFLSNFVRFYVTLALKSDIIKVNYYKNHKLIRKSILMLQKILQICLRSFVNQVSYVF